MRRARPAGEANLGRRTLNEEDMNQAIEYYEQSLIPLEARGGA
jgi:hypothetical protein